MDTKQIDRRIIRTKQGIQEALTELLEKKSINKISVKEITDIAGINRGTFYLHYVDKYDLMEKSINQLMIEISETGSNILNLAQRNIHSELSRKKLVDEFTTLFKYIQKNSRLIKSLTNENSSYSFHHKFNELLKDRLIAKLGPKQKDVPAIYIVSAFSYSIQGIIRTWLESGMEDTADMMGEYSFNILECYLKD
ncbi:TetR/AcrR family transcriptional regulator [Jeotgalibaca dankookensis]|uniref:TetR/AcrR family transcriptional regulator n=1 Tax=Jeotgalibaca dankookensis TaxID=708126 RepID=UPI000784B20F|nr:TetR/AcrR family transcriptional regulator [Jeotgalibaca dankookensis]